ncbi:hypothetical protein CGRA01v4_14455 [Colletotrichum graminicola]|nr:hypothetical protein CGRA01v4_14455 [Colletotrichum graminicola]
MHVLCCAAVMVTVQSKALVGVGPRSSVSPIRESRTRPTQSSSCLQAPIGYCVLLRLSPPPVPPPPPPLHASKVFLFYFYPVVYTLQSSMK